MQKTINNDYDKHITHWEIAIFPSGDKNIFKGVNYNKGITKQTHQIPTAYNNFIPYTELYKAVEELINKVKLDMQISCSEEKENVFQAPDHAFSQIYDFIKDIILGIKWNNIIVSYESNQSSFKEKIIPSIMWIDDGSICASWTTKSENINGFINIFFQGDGSVCLIMFIENEIELSTEINLSIDSIKENMISIIAYYINKIISC